MLMVFSQVQFIAFNTLRVLYSARVSSVIPFLTLLALWDIQVHVCSLNSCNKTTNIKASVDKISCIYTTLRALDIKPYDSHVWLGEYFDNSRLGNKWILLKIWLFLRIFLTIFVLIRTFMLSIKYSKLMILR